MRRCTSPAPPFSWRPPSRCCRSRWWRGKDLRSAACERANHLEVELRTVYVATMTLTVVSYNFLSGGSHKRSGHWSRLVRDLDADFVFAQECRPPRDCPGESDRLFNGDDGWIWAPAGSARWGSAVLTRSTRIKPIPFPRYEGWVVGGEILGLSGADGRPVLGFSIHCPVGERGYVRTLHDILDALV